MSTFWAYLNGKTLGHRQEIPKELFKSFSLTVSMIDSVANCLMMLIWKFDYIYIIYQSSYTLQPADFMKQDIFDT